MQVNGRMVRLQMEPKVMSRREALASHVQKATLTTDGEHSRRPLVRPKPREATLARVNVKKIVTKTPAVRRQANILKNMTGSGKKMVNAVQLQSQPVESQLKQQDSVHNMVKNVMKSANSVQFLTMSPKSEPITLLQGQGQSPLVIPISIVQLNTLNSDTLQADTRPMTITPIQFASNLQNIKIASFPTLSIESSVTTSSEVMSHVTFPQAEVVEVRTVDEKGAAGEMCSTAVSTATPIVSDAPWQGVLNINSEQELLEYINSQSSSAVETDQGYTILIQNVDQNTTIVSSALDSQGMLSNCSQLSSVFNDHSGMSDILPVVSNVEESVVHSRAGESNMVIAHMLDSDTSMSEMGTDKVTDEMEINSEVETETQLVGSENIIQVEITDSEMMHASNDPDLHDHNHLMLGGGMNDTDEHLAHPDAQMLEIKDESMDDYVKTETPCEPEVVGQGETVTLHMGDNHSDVTANQTKVEPQ